MTDIQMTYARTASTVDFVEGVKLPGFGFFKRFYTEPYRAYHNFDHLNQMFTLLSKLGVSSNLTMEYLSNIYLFIWWHDIIYDPKRTDNEWTSAELFKNWMPKADISKEIYDTIMDSRYLVAPINTEKWSLFCLDLDLSAMIDRDAFITNSHKIREEFSHLEDIDFYTGRQKFFRQLILKDNIFYNPYDIPYFIQGEQSVRENIEDELGGISQTIYQLNNRRK